MCIIISFNFNEFNRIILSLFTVILISLVLFHVSPAGLTVSARCWCQRRRSLMRSRNVSASSWKTKSHTSGIHKTFLVHSCFMCIRFCTLINLLNKTWIHLDSFFILSVCLFVVVEGASVQSGQVTLRKRKKMFKPVFCFGASKPVLWSFISLAICLKLVIYLLSWKRIGSFKLIAN